MSTSLPTGNVAPKRATAIPRTPPAPRPADSPAPAAARVRPPSATAPALVTRKIPNLEAKIVAAGHDPAQILQTLDTEMALRRAGRRINGQDNVQALRVLSVAMLFTLLLAALGAMSYLQNQLIGHGFKRRAGLTTTTAASANPAPGPSTPDADPGRQSARPTR